MSGLNVIKESLGFSVPIFFAQIVLFLIVLYLMNALFWKPMLAFLKARDQRIADAYKTRDQFQHEMEALRADYLARIGQIEAEARTHIQAAIKEAQTERERLIAESRAQSEAALRQGVADMERDKAESLETLRGQMVALALDVVGKSLGSAADPTAVRRSLEAGVTQGTAALNAANS